jgi:hypothetical protein
MEEGCLLNKLVPKMARKLPLRPMKVMGNLFVLVQLSFIGFVYYTYVFLVWGPKAAGE